MGKKKRKVKALYEVELPPHGVKMHKSVRKQLAAFRTHVIYCGNPGFTIDYIWRNYRLDPDDDESEPLHEMISYSYLMSIADKNQWKERRAELWQGVEERVLGAMQTDITKIRIREMGNLSAIYQTANNYITGIPDPKDPEKMLVEPIKPRSLEGLIGAMVKLDKHIEEKRLAIQQAMAAAASHQPVADEHGTSMISSRSPDLDDNLNEEEYARIAEGLAESRADIQEEEEEDA